ncbi:YbaK/EbsC family protein, partial [Arthrospira platensis SPKY1]|nr:YbaK/EbsC family protein [Arthrospira platensis SPKY1]
MNLPDVVRNHLNQRQVAYRLLACSPGETLGQTADRLSIPASRLIRIVLLEDSSGLAMAILPYNHILDFSTLCRLLQRDLEPLYGAETSRVFQGHGCKMGSHPPLPDAFDIPALVDDSLATVADDDEIYFDSGG